LLPEFLHFLKYLFYFQFIFLQLQEFWLDQTGQEISKTLPEVFLKAMAAHFITSIVYITFPIVFGLVGDRVTLRRKDVIISAKASWPHEIFVSIGIILSSTGAGLQSLASAPKLLYAIVEDHNLPCFKFLLGSEKKIVLFSGFLCVCAVMIGSIDDITPIVTMFFLVCYCNVNLCQVFMEFLRYPNWRPTFKYFGKI
jgi:amino acid transporter